MKKIKVGCYVVGMIQTNVYFLHREDSGDTIVVDPADYGRELCQELSRQGLSVKTILLTHGHFDHMLGAEALKEASGAPIYASALEKELLLDPELNTSNQIGRSCRIKADHYLIDGESVTAAGITLKMISTPGHTEGSCCYYITAEESGGDPILLSGDTLFEESVGRTDLPTGDTYDLTESIRTKLYVLPDNTKVYSGHTGPTTIGHEKKYNYFVHE